MRLIASLLVATSTAFLISLIRIGGAERAQFDQHKFLTAAPTNPAAVSNDNRVPVGTQVGDTLLLRLTGDLRLEIGAPKSVGIQVEGVVRLRVSPQTGHPLSH